MIGHLGGPYSHRIVETGYRVHPLRLMDSTYRVPLLDSKLVRLQYAWYYRIKSPSGPSSVLAALGTPQPSFWTTLNAVEPRLTYPNYYVECLFNSYRWSRVLFQHFLGGTFSFFSLLLFLLSLQLVAH